MLTRSGKGYPLSCGRIRGVPFDHSDNLEAFPRIHTLSHVPKNVEEQENPCIFDLKYGKCGVAALPNSEYCFQHMHAKNSPLGQSGESLPNEADSKPEEGGDPTKVKSRLYFSTISEARDGVSASKDMPSEAQVRPSETRAFVLSTIIVICLIGLVFLLAMSREYDPFVCTTGEEIPIDKLLDGNEDCPDGSDEEKGSSWSNSRAEQHDIDDRNDPLFDALCFGLFCGFPLGSILIGQIWRPIHASRSEYQRIHHEIGMARAKKLGARAAPEERGWLYSRPHTPLRPTSHSAAKECNRCSSTATSNCRHCNREYCSRHMYSMTQCKDCFDDDVAAASA